MTNLLDELCADADFRWDETDAPPAVDDFFAEEYEAGEVEEEEELLYAALLRQLDEFIAAREVTESVAG